MKRPVFLVSALPSLSFRFNVRSLRLRRLYEKALKERLELISTLRRENLDVRAAVLVESKRGKLKIASDYRKFERLAKRRGARIVNILDRGQYDTLPWVRNSYTAISEPTTSVTKIENFWCSNGGAVIPAGGKRLLVSDALVPPMINLLSENSLLTEEVPSSERLQKTLDFLRSKNFEVEVVPHGFGYISRGKKVWSKDIDYNLNVEPGTKTLVVEPEYYNSNKARLNEIASKWGLKIESHEKADPNFLVLEPGKVVVSKDSKETINALRNRGVNVVVGPSFKHNKALGEHGVSGEREALGGGIRCATNVLSPGIRLIAPKKMSLQVFNPIF